MMTRIHSFTTARCCWSLTCQITRKASQRRMQRGREDRTEKGGREGGEKEEERKNSQFWTSCQLHQVTMLPQSRSFLPGLASTLQGIWWVQSTMRKKDFFSYSGNSENIYFNIHSLSSYSCTRNKVHIIKLLENSYCDGLNINTRVIVKWMLNPNQSCILMWIFNISCKMFMGWEVYNVIFN